MKSIESLTRICQEAFKTKFQEICKIETLQTLDHRHAEQLAKDLLQALCRAGIEGLTAYLESHDTSASTLLQNDVVFRLKGKSPKEFLTVFGPLVLSRSLYQADRGGASHIPLDEEWGMTSQYMTPLVREAVLYAIGDGSPGDVEKLLKKCALFRPSSTAIKHLVEGEGQALEAAGEGILETLRKEEAVPEKTEVLVASLDGVNVRLAEKGVKRGRPLERPGEDLSQETLTSFHNAMVGCVNFYRKPVGEEKHPVRLKSRYVSHMPQEKALIFKERFEAEVSSSIFRAGPKVAKVLLIDGHLALAKYAKTAALFGDFEHLVDFWHAVEHLKKAGEALFGANSYDGQGWFRSWREALKDEDGAVTKLIRSIDYHRKTKRLRGERAKRIREARGYFRRNKSRMKYHEFISKGYPIGSGPVEAACKTLVKIRMVRSGMRWSREGGERVLRIRTIIKSDRWDPYWERYLELKLAA